MIARKPRPQSAGSADDTVLPVKPGQGIEGTPEPPGHIRDLAVGPRHPPKVPMHARANASLAAATRKVSLCDETRGSGAQRAQNEVRLRAPARDSPMWM